MGRVSQPSRWLAARQAIFRQIIESGIMLLVKVPTDGHRPDILTKPVTELARFELLRDGLLGYDMGTQRLLRRIAKSRKTKRKEKCSSMHAAP